MSDQTKQNQDAILAPQKLDEEMDNQIVSTENSSKVSSNEFGDEQSSSEGKQYKTSFLQLYIKGKTLMNNIFLPYLDLQEIFRLSMSCSEIKKIIDPASNKQKRRGKKFQKSSTYHLKRLAAFQLLDIPIDQALDHALVDRTFGIDVQRLSDFSQLDGQIFKKQIIAILEEEPQVQRYEKVQQFASQVKSSWLHHGSSLQLLKHLGNPLQDKIEKSKISFTKGGFFRLNYIKFRDPFHNTYILDFEILIDRVKTADDYNRLREIEQMSTKNDGPINITNFEQISSMLNGVGRLYQYKCPYNIYNQKTLSSKPSPSIFQLFGMYDGQFKNGLVDGFGVNIMAEFKKHCLGYSRKGYVCGKFIELKDQTDVRSIYDVEKLGYADHISVFEPVSYTDIDLSENLNTAKMHELRKKVLQKNMLKGVSRYCRGGTSVSLTEYKNWLKREFPDIYNDY